MFLNSMSQARGLLIATFHKKHELEVNIVKKEC